MHKKKEKFIGTPFRVLLPLLLAAGLLCGCGMMPTPANSRPEPAQVVEVPGEAGTEEPVAAEEAEKAARLAEAKDGFLWDEEGYLQAVDGEGNLVASDYVGVLHFRRDGRYSSGDRELDALVASVILKNTDPAMTRMEMLEAMYDYTVGNIRYAGLSNYECSVQPAHGRGGWMPEYAIRALRDGNGNCYCYAAAFAALARGLGFQAYATGGICGGTLDPHGWVQILDEDGNMWMCDPEIEFRFGDYQKQVEGKEPAPDLFYKSPDDIGADTGLSYRAQCDPYAAEAKEAEERANRSAKLKAAGNDDDPGVVDGWEEPMEAHVPAEAGGPAETSGPAEPAEPSAGAGAPAESAEPILAEPIASPEPAVPSAEIAASIESTEPAASAA